LKNSKKITVEEYFNLIKKKSKYKNKKVLVDCVVVDSGWESVRKENLKVSERIPGSGVWMLKFQVVFTFFSGIKYKADFYYLEGYKRVIEDAKGFLTPVFRLKRQLIFHELLRTGLINIFRESFKTGEIFDWTWNNEKNKAVRTAKDWRINEKTSQGV
jgi:hypothetical protein